jgi:hypothetical protein
VSIIALIVALTGTAVAAGPTAYQAIKGKTIIKKIGKGKLPGSKLKTDSVTGTQINESTLGTVPNAKHADTADTAGVAGSATTATTATTAGSATTASNVAGFAPNALTRVATAYDDNNAHTFSTNSTANVLNTSINAPKAGFLFITAGSDVYGGGSDGRDSTCWITLEGTEFSPSERDIQLDDTVNHEENCQTEATIAVSAGDHAVAFRASADGSVDSVNYDESTLNVLYVPFDGGGGSPTAADIAKARSSSGRHSNR